MSVLGSNAWSHLHPCTFVCCGVKFMLHGSIYTLYLCLFWGQIHGPIYSWNCDQIHGPIYTQPVLVIKSMVSFTPCICVCFGVKCLVPFTPLYFCLLWGQTHAPIYTCTFVCCGVNPWSDLHPVLVIKSMVPSCTCVLVPVVGSNSCSHLHPVLLAVVGSNPWSDLLPVFVIKSMVPFTPSLYL